MSIIRQLRAIRYLVELAILETGHGQVAVVFLVKDDAVEESLQKQCHLLGPILAQVPLSQVGQEEGALGHQQASLKVCTRQEPDEQVTECLAGGHLHPPAIPGGRSPHTGRVLEALVGKVKVVDEQAAGMACQLGQHEEGARQAEGMARGQTAIERLQLLADYGLCQLGGGSQALETCVQEKHHGGHILVIRRLQYGGKETAKDVAQGGVGSDILGKERLVGIVTEDKVNSCRTRRTRLCTGAGRVVLYL